MEERESGVERRRDKGKVHMMHKCEVIGIVVAQYLKKEKKVMYIRTYVHTVYVQYV